MIRFIVHHPTRPSRRKTVKEADLGRYVAAGWVPVGQPLVGDNTGPEVVTFPDPIEIAPPSGPISEVLDWVDGDPDRAEAALSAEQAGSARTSLIRQLEKVADGDNNEAPDGEKEQTQ